MLLERYSTKSIKICGSMWGTLFMLYIIFQLWSNEYIKAKLSHKIISVLKLVLGNTGRKVGLLIVNRITLYTKTKQIKLNKLINSFDI